MTSGRIRLYSDRNRLGIQPTVGPIRRRYFFKNVYRKIESQEPSAFTRIWLSRIRRRQHDLKASKSGQFSALHCG